MYKTEEYLLANKRDVDDLLSTIALLAERKLASSQLDEFIAKAGNIFLGGSEVKKNRMSVGHFSLDDFSFLGQILQRDGLITGSLNKPDINQLVIRKLLEHNLLWPQSLSMPTEYQANTQLFLALYEAEGNILDNALYGVDHLIKKLLPSIPAINIKKDNGDKTSGTGFLFIKPRANTTNCTHYIITNKHVLEHGRSSIESIKSNLTDYQIDGEIELSPKYDLAAIPVASTDNVPLNFGVSSKALDYVITIGYPKIPLSDQVVVYHDGKVNGITKSYLPEAYPLMLISCDVAPGNSGCPVINEWGFCVGIVTQENQGDYLESSDNGGTKQFQGNYNMAIPGDILREFIFSLP